MNTDRIDWVCDTNEPSWNTSIVATQEKHLCSSVFIGGSNLLRHSHRRSSAFIGGFARFAVALAACISIVGPGSVAADPHADYMLHCQGCHGPDGAGAPGAVPTFRGQVGKFLLVPGGREYLIRVPGVSQSELSDARVAEVLNWIVAELDGGGQPAGEARFTADEVSRHRRPPLADVDAVRAGLMRELQVSGDQ